MLERNKARGLGMRTARWLIAALTLVLTLLAGSIGGVASSFTDSEASLANSFQAWTSMQWLQTTQEDFEAGLPIQADTRSSPGDVELAKDSHIFAFQGGGVNLWAYGVPASTWSPMTGAPNVVGGGGALAYDGVRYVYALRGNNSRAFWRYDAIVGAWTVLANAPANVGTGGALAYDGARYVYALRGNVTAAFWRYDTTLNTWAARANTPASVSAGGALTYAGSGYIYALRGSNRASLWRYDVAGNSWTAMADAPRRVGAGGALSYDGAGSLYAFRGNNQTAFWRYDTSGNSWASLANTPGRVGAGGALAYAGSGYIYASRGNGTTDFWRYDVLGNSWTSMTNAPGNVADGGALAFVDATAYVNSGTIASQVRDTGMAQAGWDALFWDEALPAGTDITFEVRTSDTLFTADDATLTWTSIGGTSPETSGLPSGQYMQWRATLTTLDITVTPILEEVRVYYY
jgi:outer membrane protein assembly factor BamB